MYEVDQTDGDETGDDGERDDDEEILTNYHRATPVSTGQRHVYDGAVNCDRNGRESRHRRLSAVHRDYDQIKGYAVAVRQAAGDADDAQVAIDVEQAGSSGGVADAWVTCRDVSELERDARVDAAVGVAGAQARDHVTALRTRRHQVGDVQ